MDLKAGVASPPSPFSNPQLHITVPPPTHTKGGGCLK